MPGKRKRTRPNHLPDSSQKRQKISPTARDPIIKQALLPYYYPQVLTLREYLLRRLPNTSKIRRKKIISVGRNPPPENLEPEERLSAFLDKTLVGVSMCHEVSREERWAQWTTFPQRADESASTLPSLSAPGVYSQSEVCFPSCYLIFVLTWFVDCRFCHLAALFQEECLK